MASALTISPPAPIAAPVAANSSASALFPLAVSPTTATTSSPWAAPSREAGEAGEAAGPVGAGEASGGSSARAEGERDEGTGTTSQVTVST